MRKFSQVASAFLGAALLAGCTSPYAIPEIEEELTGKPPAEFPGVADYLEAGDTRIVWIHGMCDHGASWALNRHALLEKALDAERVDPSRLMRLARAQIRQPEVFHFEDRRGSSTLYTDFIVWSPFNDQFKNRLLYDNSDDEKKPEEVGVFPYERASLNKELKKLLINRCLIDAVAYAGENGDRIKEWVQGAVCESLGGTFSGRCRIPPTGIPPRTILVAESLGSKMLFDAIREIWKDSQSPGVAAQLASVQQVYLLANQIPLLDAADMPASLVPTRQTIGIESGLSALVDARARISRSAEPLPDLQVIAFTDPNDLLSYRLSKDVLREQRAQVVNVIVSNDPTYFGFVARPDLAHCGYKWNLHVFGTLVHGYEGGGKVIAVNSDPDEVCGLVSDEEARSAQARLQ